MEDKKKAEIYKLKVKAASLYIKATDFGNLKRLAETSGGYTVARYLRPHMDEAEKEFFEVMEKLKELDPENAPYCPTSII